MNASAPDSSDSYLDHDSNDGVLVDSDVIQEMVRTPVSLRDDRYEKAYVECLALAIDLRGFSSFTLEADRDRVTLFLEKYTQELLAAVNGYSVSYYKLLGDGALVIWDEPEPQDAEACRDLFRLLREVVTDIALAYESTCALAGALALGTLYKYEIFGECSGLKYRDYVGYALNTAFRLQTLAHPGELVAAPAVDTRFGLGAPLMENDRKPERSSIKGIRDEDYDGIVVIERP